MPRAVGPPFYSRVEDLVEKGMQKNLTDIGSLITSGFVSMYSLAFVAFGDSFGLLNIRLLSCLVGGLLISRFFGCIPYRILMLLLSVISGIFESDFYEVEV